MSFKLRIYSGLHAGAEVRLEQGRVVIGADPAQADLVLMDTGIAAIHLVLMVEPGGVRLLEWAESEVPEQEGVAMLPGSDLQAFSAQRCGPLRWAFCAQDQVLPDRLPADGPCQPSRRSGSVTWMFVPGSGLLGLLVLLAWLLASGSVVPDVQALEDPQQALQQFLREQQLPALNSQRLADGAGDLISGYLPRNDQYLNLQRYLELRGTAFRLEVWTLEALRNNADAALVRLGHGHLHSLDGQRPGWLSLAGDRPAEPLQIRQLEQQLMAEVPGLLGLDPQPKLIEPAQAAPAAKLDFPIRAVALGRVPYVTLRDNRRYPVGGMTPSGISVQAIDAQAITLRKGGRYYVINLKDGPVNDG